MGDRAFKVEINNKLAIITLSRPKKKNALNLDAYLGITKVLNDISVREDVTITVLTGQGDFYSSGNDLTSALTDISGDLTFEDVIDNTCDVIRDFVDSFINHKKVLVAVVNGPAIGIAVTTLPLCDIVYCTSNAWFQTPFALLGLCAEGSSSFTFPRIFGSSKANQLLLFAERLSAEEALTSGFVGRVVPKEDLETQIWQPLRNHALKLNTNSLNETKALLRTWDEVSLKEANRKEVEKLKQLFRSPEAMNAIISFKNRRSKL